MVTKEQVLSLRKALAEVVERKREATRVRLAYKRSTPVSEERSSKLRELWGEAGVLKEEIRQVTLVYAFARGRRYWISERSTLHPIHPRDFFSSLTHYGVPATLEDAQAWIQAQPSPEEKAAYDAFLAAAKAKAAEDGRKRSAANRRAA